MMTQGREGTRILAKRSTPKEDRKVELKKQEIKKHVFEPRVMTGVLTTPPINGNGSRSHRKGFVSLLIRRASVCVCVCVG